MGIESTAKIVVDVLAADPETRDDDNRLAFEVLGRILTGKEKSQVLTLRKRDLRKLPQFATITRMRAVIQNELGKYLPTSEAVRRRRRISEAAWEQWLTGTPTFAQFQG
ncbi:MAG TPA: hypothetical protein VMW16_08660 [Sedimentisphaerales bacterium]|nr:hypothetical protein [Sedimentisphaerales bacterium]